MIPIASNPFSTRFVAPGAVEYFFQEGISAKSIIDKLAFNQWRGQIVGPHGTGKTSLLWALYRELQSLHGTGSEFEPSRVEFIQFQGKIDGGTPAEKELAHDSMSLPTSFPRHIRFVDGFEQMSWLARRQMSSQSKIPGEGLIVSSHRKLPLPTIFESEANARHFRSIVAKLMLGRTFFSNAEIDEALSSNHGNIREALFELYDRWEDKTRLLA